MNIRSATKKDYKALLEMALSLWPDEPEEQLRKELEEILGSARQIIFVATDKNDNYVGFINVSTRREYVSGATSYPIGYIKGIYVKPEYRHRGMVRKLVEIGEKWAAEKGCKQMASDTWLWNTGSQEFHLKIGFMEKERLVTYIKKIT